MSSQDSMHGYRDYVFADRRTMKHLYRMIIGMNVDDCKIFSNCVLQDVLLFTHYSNVDKYMYDSLIIIQHNSTSLAVLHDELV